MALSGTEAYCRHMPVMAQYGVFGFQLGVASLAVHQSHVQRGKVFLWQFHKEGVATSPAPTITLNAADEPLASSYGEN